MPGFYYEPHPPFKGDQRAGFEGRVDVFNLGHGLTFKDLEALFLARDRYISRRARPGDSSSDEVMNLIRRSPPLNIAFIFAERCG